MLKTLPPNWNQLIRSLPAAHVLQSAEWGDFKQRSTGWLPESLTFTGHKNIRGAALTLTRRVGPFAVMYVPKGPMLDYSDPAMLTVVLGTLERIARERRVIWLKIDPDVTLGEGIPGTDTDRPNPAGEQTVNILRNRGWVFSASQVQYRNTLLINLNQAEDEILKNMSQSTRYKVRYGPKHGVMARAGTQADLPLLYKLYAETGQRDGFLTRPYSYYEDEWGVLMKAGIAHPIIAEYEGQALAHVILFKFGGKCWYFYGASSNEHRNLMPTYLLQWEAMRWAKQQGCAWYDFWGAPDEFLESDPMWGVFRWKEGFGGTVTRTIGAWDYRPFPLLDTLYSRAMPAILGTLKRLRGHK